MPLTLVQAGESGQIRQVFGRKDTRRFLEGLGFVVGSEVQVVARMSGNVIVNIKNSRVAISREMANRIIV